MSGISPISGYSYNSYTDYGKFASGKQIQSAADGAAELAIIQKEDAQARGYEVGANNIAAGKDLLNVADGAMAGITEQLQRMRELAVQASNTAVMTDSDRANIQMEIDQLKQGISDIATQTTFNTKPLLDGSNQELNIMRDGNGNGSSIELPNAMLQELGIADFDVTGDFNIEDIDKALEKVSAGRSKVGAQTNALEYAYNYNKNTGLNTIGAKSRLEDLDIPQAISDLKKNQLLQEYSMHMQKKRMEDEANRMRNLFF
ncbi:MAG: flagellin FliC5 [Lachnospiraceae bacterium]|nr:flagellin FliC5 [Lachnospiraceae bacterium]